VLLLLLAATLFPMAYAIRQQKRRWLSYKLTLSPTDITQTRDGLPAITISFEEITQIQEFTGDGLYVKTAHRHKFISIPVSLNGYEKIKSRLAQLREIEPKSRWTNPVKLVLACLLGFGLGVLQLAVRQSQTTTFVLPGGIVLLLLWGWFIYEMQRSQELSQTHKRLLWLTLFFPLNLIVKLMSVVQ
jgi:hypothetical protein